MKKLLVIVIALMTVLVPQVYAQSSQEVANEAFFPRNPISQLSTYALTDVVVLSYSGAATAVSVTMDTGTMTITIDAVPTVHASVNSITYAALKVLIEAAHPGVTVTLADSTLGNETCDIADHTLISILGAGHGLNATTKLTLGTKLYMASLRPAVYRVIANTTYGSGNSKLKIYRGSAAETNTLDTLVYDQVLAATTVDKVIDFAPFMMPGSRGGYLKVFVVNSAAMTAGELTVFGAYK